MKKFKFLAFAGCSLFFTSCVTSTYMVTDNPVGTKQGVAKMALFGADKDISLEKACKNGEITSIGTVEVRTTYFIFPFVKTTVTGE
jgi:hypothetical protein